MAQAEIERQQMRLFVEKAEAWANEEERLRQQTLAEAHDVFAKQEPCIQREREEGLVNKQASMK
eukprot:11180492-Prorocentrum_lima.AAC.1